MVKPQQPFLSPTDINSNPYLPHPALRLPNVLPFLASKQHEEAVMAAMMQQRMLQSLSAMSSLMSPQPANPFLLPLMGRTLPHPAMMKPASNPLFHSQQQQKMMSPPLTPPTQPMMRLKEPHTKHFFNSPPAQPAPEKIETVNGGFGIKNPLAKNPALQDHLLQTMGKFILLVPSYVLMLLIILD